MSKSDVDSSGELGQQGKGSILVETPRRQLHVTHRTSSCPKEGGQVQVYSKPRGARGIEPELLACPLITDVPLVSQR